MALTTWIPEVFAAFIKHSHCLLFFFVQAIFLVVFFVICLTLPCFVLEFILLVCNIVLSFAVFYEIQHVKCFHLGLLVIWFWLLWLLFRDPLQTLHFDKVYLTLSLFVTTSTIYSFKFLATLNKFTTNFSSQINLCQYPSFNTSKNPSSSELLNMLHYWLSASVYLHSSTYTWRW